MQVSIILKQAIRAEPDRNILLKRVVPQTKNLLQNYIFENQIFGPSIKPTFLNPFLFASIA